MGVWVKLVEKMGVCVCIFLYVFKCLKPKRQKELNVLIAYCQVSKKNIKNHID
jgi:hypothetical protein